MRRLRSKSRRENQPHRRPCSSYATGRASTENRPPWVAADAAAPPTRARVFARPKRRASRIRKPSGGRRRPTRWTTRWTTNRPTTGNSPRTTTEEGLWMTRRVLRPRRPRRRNPRSPPRRTLRRPCPRISRRAVRRLGREVRASARGVDPRRGRRRDRRLVRSRARHRTRRRGLGNPPRRLRFRGSLRFRRRVDFLRRRDPPIRLRRYLRRVRRRRRRGPGTHPWTTCAACLASPGPRTRAVQLRVAPVPRR